MLVHISSPRVHLCALLLAAFGAVAGCATVVSPDQQVSMSRDAVSRAVAAQAPQYAPLEMKTAQDKLFAMEHAMGEKDYVKARLLAEQAEADAHLAEAKAQAVKQSQTLKQARDGINVLKKEMLEAPSATTATPAVNS
ncbi:DUF4398 domain-containing protein [Pseudomonas protegens]|uniref:DUF4398 domain-containing protein n=1 Tax=Pseudomonas protegens TaxID=380021 RepID=UPI000F475F5A|nr:DUF4398 domain-containing protein [Pseudomonas protegens]ROL94056.1 chromosome segregation ATPase [Pseudomonas protegens]ROM00226.1 chromosome segregation ATPase [Pseudomonas protegens]ROM03716.1 chromosome segregation ATPase [Pseudomonas protegens]ROM11024.1 chromosome segregation ATPase [Pseudomonas protegens]